MRTNITRRFAAALVVPVAVLGLAACNDDNDDSSGSDQPNDTTSQENTENGADSTDDGGDATDTDNGADGATNNDEFIKLLESGLENTTTARMSMEIDAAGMSTTAEGILDYSGDMPATQMTMTMPGASGGGEMEMIMVDGVIYMTMPGMTTDGSYLMIDPKSNPELADQMGGMDSLDLGSTTKMLTEGLEKAEKVGEEDIDGVATSHYVVTVNTDAAKEMLGDMEQGAGAAEIPDSLTYDVWLDSEGRMVQVNADINGTGTVKMNMSDFGADVSIEAPPADKVQDMSEMMSGMSGQ